MFVYFLVDMDEVKHKKPELVRKFVSECMVNDPAKLPLPADLVQTNK
jgi:tagatose-1,6-bisphosphate aldolase